MIVAHSLASMSFVFYNAINFFLVSIGVLIFETQQLKSGQHSSSISLWIDLPLIHEFNCVSARLKYPFFKLSKGFLLVDVENRQLAFWVTNGFFH
jgi:hypothetical protein